MKTYPLYLNGELKTTQDTHAVVNPATGEKIGLMSRVSRKEVASAIAAAHEAFLAWRTMTGKQRGEMLRKIAVQVQARADELAKLITLENGKPLSQSQGEVAMTLDHLGWFAEEARRGYGRFVPHQTSGKRNLVLKTPYGVVGAISPWNFPLVLAVRKIAPALAAGCAVVLKPASATPLCASVFAECVHAAGLPKNVFQLVAGSASEIGKEFLENSLCRKITFTGSTEVGKELIRGAAEQVKPLSLELGGHAPVLVFDDADIKTAVEGVILAKFRNSGQSCIAANRVYVQKKIYPDFVKAFVERVKTLPVGNGLDPKSEIGALIDEAAVKKAEEHVKDAVERGAKVLCGGNRMPGPGLFFEATVLVDVPPEGLCMCEETFAPVAPLCPFDDDDQGIAWANQSPYGLSGYAFTQSIGRMFRVAETLEAGIIGINDGVPTTTQAPFGGMKQSGWGRELGSEGMEAFLETKHISIVV